MHSSFLRDDFYGLTMWLSPQALHAWYYQGPTRRGASYTYSALAIQTALMMRLLFHLPLRQTEGFLSSILELMGVDLAVPDHTTLSRRHAGLIALGGQRGQRVPVFGGELDVLFGPESTSLKKIEIPNYLIFRVLASVTKKKTALVDSASFADSRCSYPRPPFTLHTDPDV